MKKKSIFVFWYILFNANADCRSDVRQISSSAGEQWNLLSLGSNVLVLIAIICVKYEIYIWNLEHYFQLFISCLRTSWELQCSVRDMTIKSPCNKGSSMWNIRIFQDKIKNLLIQNPFYYLAQIFCIWLHKANFIMTFVLRWAMNPMNLLLRLCLLELNVKSPSAALRT